MNHFIFYIFIFLSVVIAGCTKGDNSANPDIKAGKWEIISKADNVPGLEKIYFTDSQNGWIIGDSGWVSATTNGGITWTRQDVGTGARLRSICFTDSKHGFIGGADRYLIQTTDGGKTFSIQYSYNESDPIADIYFLDNNHGWALTFRGTVIRFSR